MNRSSSDLGSRPCCRAEDFRGTGWSGAECSPAMRPHRIEQRLDVAARWHNHRRVADGRAVSRGGSVRLSAVAAGTAGRLVSRSAVRCRSIADRARGHCLLSAPPSSSLTSSRCWAPVVRSPRSALAQGSSCFLFGVVLVLLWPTGVRPGGVWHVTRGDSQRRAGDVADPRLRAGRGDTVGCRCWWHLADRGRSLLWLFAQLRWFGSRARRFHPSKSEAAAWRA